jgi:hypothetical protein
VFRAAFEKRPRRGTMRLSRPQGLGGAVGSDTQRQNLSLPCRTRRLRGYGVPAQWTTGLYDRRPFVIRTMKMAAIMMTPDPM